MWRKILKVQSEVIAIAIPCSEEYREVTSLFDYLNLFTSAKQRNIIIPLGFEWEGKNHELEETHFRK